MTPLDDATAVYVIKKIAHEHLPRGESSPPAPADVREALAGTFGVAVGTEASEGDLARAALDLLAEDPEFSGRIHALVRSAAMSPASHRHHLDPGTVALTAAALLVLQTRVKFKRTPAGKWSLEIEKKASSEGALKRLAERLLAFLPNK